MEPLQLVGPKRAQENYICYQNLHKLMNFVFISFLGNVRRQLDRGKIESQKL